MDGENVCDIYHDLFQKTWDKMVDIVGIHTVKVLVQRSLWLTRQKYTEADLIRVTDEGILCDGLEGLEPSRYKQVMEDLFATLVDILTRLVGEEITKKIADGIDVFEIRKVRGGE